MPAEPRSLFRCGSYARKPGQTHPKRSGRPSRTRNARISNRILLLGDSFTFGARATVYNKCFAAILDREVAKGHDTVIWNSGIPGIGQKQEFLELQELAPTLRPQLAILLFCINDFEDNLNPVGKHYVFKGPQWIERYSRQPDGAFVELTPRETFLRTKGFKGRKDYLRVSRLMTIAIKAWDFGNMVALKYAHKWGLINPSKAELLTSQQEWDQTLGTTRELVREIRDYCVTKKIELLVLPIPYAGDCKDPSNQYQGILETCKNLGISTFEVRNLLNAEDYEAAPGDHWLDSGHRKVATALGEKIRSIFPSISENEVK